jgi:hypothetical protein
MTRAVLYRRFLRILKAWPEQENREFRFKSCVLEKMKTQFRLEEFDENKLSETINLLQDIKDSNIQKKYSLNPDLIKAHLPTPNHFQLLDKEGQAVINQPRSPTSILVATLFGQLRFRQ